MLKRQKQQFSLSPFLYSSEIPFLDFSLNGQVFPQLTPILLIAGMLSGLVSGVILGILYVFNINRVIKLISGLIFAITIAIILKIFNFNLSPYIPRFILVSVLITAGYNFIREEIKPVEKIQFNSNRIQKFSVLGLFVGALYVLIKLYIGLGDYDEVGYGYMVFEILICVIVFGILGGFTIQTQAIPQHKARPNEGIKRAKKYSLISFATVVPIVALIGWVIDKPNDPFYLICLGLSLGLLAWLCAGEGSGIVLIQHFTLRLILYCKKYIPWNYARFLDYASNRKLMKKVGGGYVFYHRMLMEHFAQRNPKS